MIREKTCCFTGHRPQNLPWKFNEKNFACEMLKENLKKEIENAIHCGYTHFLSGMALGVDMFAFEILLALKEEHPTTRIHLIAVIPCRDQYEKWNDKDQHRYFSILSKCNETIVISEKYTKDSMFKRNRHMIDCSSLLISVCDNNSRGGTLSTINYAKQMGLTTINIIP